MFGSYDKAVSPNYLDFHKGEMLHDSITAKVTFDVFQSCLIDYDVLYHDKGGIPLVSSQLAEVLKKIARERVQFIRTTVACRDGDSDGFWSLNIVGFSEIIDLGNSDYFCLPGTSKPIGFHRMSTRIGSLDGLEIGRDRNFPPAIFVTSSLAEVLMKSSGNKLRFD